MTKVCTKCGEERPLDSFRPGARYTGGRHTQCRPCESERSRAWAAANPEKVSARMRAWRRTANGRAAAKRDYVSRREALLQFQYGIGIADWERMLVAQGGRCAACGDPMAAQGPAGVNVDHCHTTGVVRGLLCGLCNRSLGALRDDPERVRGLLQYIEGPR